LVLKNILFIFGVSINGLPIPKALVGTWWQIQHSIRFLVMAKTLGVLDDDVIYLFVFLFLSLEGNRDG
jgi:hypothetical protein